MDKQKQIEEMAKHGCYDGCASGLRKFCEEYDGKPCKNMVRIASGLYEQGYRKILENAVVLTNENEIKQYEWSKMLDKMGVFKFADKVRKETAEKFAERLKFRLEKFVRKIMREDYQQGAYIYMVESSDIETCIDEICKEITEGK